MITKKTLSAFFIGLLILPIFVHLSQPVLAQTSEIDKLQQDIVDRADRLAEIEKEIAKFEADLKVVGAEKQTLQKAINQLTLERKKVQAEISKTTNLITSTDLEINKLILEISKAERSIQQNEAAIAEIIRAEYRAEETSLVELLLTHKQLSDFWSSFEAYEAVRDSMATKVAELDSLKRLLEEKRGENTTKRSELLSLKNQYSDQNSVLANNQAEHTDLL